MSLEQRIQDSFELSEDELKEELPGLLEDLEGKTAELVEENPEILTRLMTRMEEIDTAEFASDAPEVAEQFQDFLWDTTKELVKRDEELRSEIDIDIKVNFEANDSPMKGHLVVDKEEEVIRGGSGLLDDGDLHITADSNTLVGLLTGNVDPVQGFMSGQYEMDGPVDKGMQLAPIMTSMTESFANA